MSAGNLLAPLAGSVFTEATFSMVQRLNSHRERKHLYEFMQKKLKERILKEEEVCTQSVSQSVGQSVSQTVRQSCRRSSNEEEVSDADRRRPSSP